MSASRGRFSSCRVLVRGWVDFRLQDIALCCDRLVDWVDWSCEFILREKIVVWGEGLSLGCLAGEALVWEWFFRTDVVFCQHFLVIFVD